MSKTRTSNGKRGGLLEGKPHYDKDGNSLGGIKAVVTDAGGKPVELEGGEVIINKEASKKYWKELSKINQSAGNGVPILPPDGALTDEDPEEFSEGGNIIEFNANHLPNKWITEYATKIKEDYPEIWNKGGNIFGNEAFKNLSRVRERGYWLDSEEWMYIKWRSFVARHKKDFRIAGVVAMLKWCDKVEKGWGYMKTLIEKEIANLEKKKKPSAFKQAIKEKSLFKDGGKVSKTNDSCQVLDKDGNPAIDDASLAKMEKCIMKLTQTKDMNLNANGKYKLARRKLHKKIIDEFKKNAVCITKGRPIAILMGGSPASGKSSFLKRYRPFLLKEEILKVDADEIRAKLPEYKGYNATQTHQETKDIVTTLISDRNIGVPCDFDLIYDGTMNNVRSYKPLIELLRTRNYKIFIVYMDKVPKEVIMQRMKERYLKTGRFVPAEVVDDFFQKGTSAFEELKPLVDGYLVIDGSNQDYDIIEKGGMQLPEDRAYSKLGQKISAEELEKIEYKDGGNIDKKDSVEMDIPLLIRVMEFAREDIKSDPELHHVVERLIEIRDKGVLTMKDYDFIADLKKKEKFSQIERKYANGGTVLLAPNGKPSNLTTEQYKLVRTPEFKAWFGDWENDPKNASKVVDSNGEPLVCYHGSNADFNIFDKDKIASNNPTDKAKLGFWFTDDLWEAEGFAYGFDENKRNENGRVIFSFLNIREPINVESYNVQKQLNKKYFKDRDISGMYIEANQIQIKEMLNSKNDGIVLKPIFIVFESNQIKLADGTNTTFDPNNDDIRFDDGGEIKIDEIIFKVKIYLEEHSYDRETDTETPMWFCRVIKMNENDVDGILTEDNDLEGLNIGNFDSRKKARDFLLRYSEELNVILLDDNGIGYKFFNSNNADIRFKTGGMTKKNYVSYKDKFNKKYGYSENESHTLSEISKDSGVSMKGLQQIYNKGIGAYKTNPSSVRPNVKSKEQWAMARVYSSVMGGKAAKVDAKELQMATGGAIAHDKFKTGGEIPKKNKHGGSIDNERIVCQKCDWSWKVVDGGHDLYVCHKCGYDNAPYYESKLKSFKNEGSMENETPKVKLAVKNKIKQLAKRIQEIYNLNLGDEDDVFSYKGDLSFSERRKLLEENKKLEAQLDKITDTLSQEQCFSIDDKNFQGLNASGDYGYEEEEMFAGGGGIDINEPFNVNGKTLAERVRILVKQLYPDYKWSITSSYSKMDVYLMEADFDPFTDLFQQENPDRKYYSVDDRDLSDYNRQNNPKITDRAVEVFKPIREYINKYVENRNAGDPYADYSNYNVYEYTYIGKWDKPYKQVEPKVGKKAKAKATVTPTTATATPSPTTSTPRADYPFQVGDVLAHSSEELNSYTSSRAFSASQEWYVIKEINETRTTVLQYTFQNNQLTIIYQTENIIKDYVKANAPLFKFGDTVVNKLSPNNPQKIKRRSYYQQIGVKYTSLEKRFVLSGMYWNYELEDGTYANENELEFYNATPITTTQEKGLPSTDPQTWNAQYKVGDKVKIRWDFSNDLGLPATKGNAKVDYFSNDNNFTIVRIDKRFQEPEATGGIQRTENPTGLLYILSNRLFSWEGKDLELVDRASKSNSATPTTQPQYNFLDYLTANSESANKYGKNLEISSSFAMFVNAANQIENMPKKEYAELMSELLDKFPKTTN